MRFLFPLGSLFGRNASVHVVDEDAEDVIIPEGLAWKPDDTDDDPFTRSVEEHEELSGEQAPLDDVVTQNESISVQSIDEDLSDELPDPPSAPWHIAAYSEEAIPVDVVRSRAYLHVYANVAGVRASDIRVELKSDLLTIKALPTAPWEHHDDIEGFYALECSSAPRARSLILPVQVDPYSVRATLRFGILDLAFTLASESPRVVIEEIDEDEEDHS